MALHRSISSSSFSSSSSSTLLLHPLDIHFLAEPYGPPLSSPPQSTLPPSISTLSSLPPPSTPLALGSSQAPESQKAPSTNPSHLLNTQDTVGPLQRSAPFVMGSTDGGMGSTDGSRGSTDGSRGSTDGGKGSTDGGMGSTDGSRGSTDGTTGPSKATSLPTTPTATTNPLPQASTLPKVQVCGRGGVWWALNAGVLLLYRDLHAHGHCSCVRAEIVPLHKVPGPLQTAMVLDSEDVSETRALLPDSSRTTKRGYDRLTAAEEDANGNTSPALRRAPPKGTSAPTSAATTAQVTTPSSDLEVASTGSASIVESSSDYDHYMSQSDSDDSDDDDDEALTCNVCDRAFPTSRLLASHQTRKRHYGCSTCENVFPTLMALEAHKEETNHWSDDDLFLDDDDDDDDDLDEFYDDEENEEEREKLL